MIYFDNAASTPPAPQVVENYKLLLTHFYSNPSSLHKEGLSVANAVLQTSKRIAQMLGVSQEEILYTSGATESNNLVIQSFGRRKNKKIIATKSQHSSVTEPLKQLISQGMNVVFLETEGGRIDPLSLEQAVDEDTLLVCLTHVNNETGVIEDVATLGTIIKKKNKKTIVHVDGVQGFGKIPLDVKRAYVDTYAFSAHKIHGLKGVGGLYIKKGVTIHPLIFGGLQQGKIRPGTENTVGILSLQEALERVDIKSDYAYVAHLNELFWGYINEIESVVRNGKGSPYIMNVSFKGVNGETVLNALSLEGICVSIGSACNRKNLNENLLAHGYEKERVLSAVRFSFSRYNTEEEVRVVGKKVQEIVRGLRGEKSKYGL